MFRGFVLYGVMVMGFLGVMGRRDVCVGCFFCALEVEWEERGVVCVDGL